MQVSLVMFKSDSTRREFPVNPEGFVIGRKNNCDLRIPLSSVSRQHCELKVVDDQVLLRDAGSSNGTYHNNIRVTEAVLAAGDELVIGPVVFTVVIDGQPEGLKPVRSLVDSSENMQGSSLVLPTDLMELPNAPTASGTGDTITDNPADLDDDDEDPLAALDRLVEMELPDRDKKS